MARSVDHLHFGDEATAAAFMAFAEPARQKLLDVRALIFDVARQTPGVGRLEEALRWGQPSYLTPETGSGSTVRLGTMRNLPGNGVIFFHCQSGLIDQFRTLYGNELSFVGDRGIAFRLDQATPTRALRHCLALALTHHLRKRAMPKLRK